MTVTDLDSRRNSILQAVIEAYVETASPVGSELIARKLRSSLSSATIRNIMGSLEEIGFLIQPHTSAGRVPTDRGYRFYVDAVMEAPQLPSEEFSRMAELVDPREIDLDQLLERASAILAELTHEAAFAIVPTMKRSPVKQVELVPISVRKVLCVLIANGEMIASHIVEIEQPMTRDEAASLARFINMELVGLPFQELLESLERRMLGEADSFYHFVKRSLDILQHALSTEPDERLFVDGASYVVDQPEFHREPRRTYQFLKVLDAQEGLLARIRQDLKGSGVRIRIGSEVQVPGLETCSYVMVPFIIGEQVMGAVGVLGPTRMDYPRMSACVEGMGRCLNDILNRLISSGS